MIWIGFVAIGIACFGLGCVWGIEYAQDEAKRVRFEIDALFREESNGKKTCEKENEEKDNHVHGKNPKTCPGRWRNCPGSGCTGEIFAYHYTVPRGRAEDSGI